MTLNLAFGTSSVQWSIGADVQGLVIIFFSSLDFLDIILYEVFSIS